MKWDFPPAATSAEIYMIEFVEIFIRKSVAHNRFAVTGASRVQQTYTVEHGKSIQLLWDPQTRAEM